MNLLPIKSSRIRVQIKIKFKLIGSFGIIIGLTVLLGIFIIINIEVIQKNYDLILLDLAMPEFSGFDIVKALSDSDEIESNNIVIVTASSKVDEEQELLDAGAKEILRKPVSILDIKKLVEKYRPK